MSTLALFANLPRDRPRIVRMHVVDAGGNYDVHLKCSTCGHDAGWVNLEQLGLTISQAKRGVPCPVCNATGPPGDA